MSGAFSFTSKSENTIDWYLTYERGGSAMLADKYAAIRRRKAIELRWVYAFADPEGWDAKRLGGMFAKVFAERFQGVLEDPQEAIQDPDGVPGGYRPRPQAQPGYAVPLLVQVSFLSGLAHVETASAQESP